MAWIERDEIDESWQQTGDEVQEREKGDVEVLLTKSTARAKLCKEKFRAASLAGAENGSGK